MSLEQVPLETKKSEMDTLLDQLQALDKTSADYEKQKSALLEQMKPLSENIAEEKKMADLGGREKEFYFANVLDDLQRIADTKLPRAEIESEASENKETSADLLQYRKNILESVQSLINTGHKLQKFLEGRDFLIKKRFSDADKQLIAGKIQIIIDQVLADMSDYNPNDIASAKKTHENIQQAFARFTIIMKTYNLKY
ncbi:hypothetical protein KKH39_03890 [Patescibacteria group bacterium]|nr:hypothetical protein [Patescibacteria group bacterium]